MVLLGKWAGTFLVSPLFHHHSMRGSLVLKKCYCDQVVGLCLRRMVDLEEHGAPEYNLFELWV